MTCLPFTVEYFPPANSSLDARSIRALGSLLAPPSWPWPQRQVLQAQCSKHRDFRRIDSKQHSARYNPIDQTPGTRRFVRADKRGVFVARLSAIISSAPTRATGTVNAINRGPPPSSRIRNPKSKTSRTMAIAIAFRHCHHQITGRTKLVEILLKKTVRAIVFGCALAAFIEERLRQDRGRCDGHRDLLGVGRVVWRIDPFGSIRNVRRPAPWR